MRHFYQEIPEDLRTLSHQDAVARYVEGAGVPAAAIAGLDAEQLNRHPVAGTWSLQQIVLHLMDTDLIASHRMKRIIAEEQPRLDVYDETAFSQKLSYERMDATAACEIFRLNRLLMGALLRRVPEADFERAARHPEVGELALGTLVRLYVRHLDHHLRFLREKRRMVESITTTR